MVRPIFRNIAPCLSGLCIAAFIAQNNKNKWKRFAVAVVGVSFFNRATSSYTRPNAPPIFSHQATLFTAKTAMYTALSYMVILVSTAIRTFLKTKSTAENAAEAEAEARIEALEIYTSLNAATDRVTKALREIKRFLSIKSGIFEANHNNNKKNMEEAGLALNRALKAMKERPMLKKELALAILHLHKAYKNIKKGAIFLNNKFLEMTAQDLEAVAYYLKEVIGDSKMIETVNAAMRVERESKQPD